MFGSQWFASPDDGFQIGQSCLFDATNGSYLYRVQTAGDRRQATYSAWYKRSTPAAAFAYLLSAGTGYETVRLTSTNALQMYNANVGVASNRLFADTSSWYHVVSSFDNDQSTAADRSRFWINGVEVTSFSAAAYPNVNTDFTKLNVNDVIALIGAEGPGDSIGPGVSRFFDGYIAEVNYLDGTAVTNASLFGEINAATGQWVPKEVSASTVTYGTNGFQLQFADSSDLGADTSGESNGLTGGGLVAADKVSDSPTDNYCIWNERDTGTGTLTDGGLTLSGTTDRSGTFAMPSGKWAWKITTAASGNFGVVSGASLTGTESVYAAGSGEVLEFQLDIDNGTLEVSVDGGSYSSVATGLTSGAPYLPLAKAACAADFGQRGFTLDDSTFSYLSTSNLPTPTVGDPSQQFQTVLYAGNGSARSIAQSGNANFQVDAVWIKNRDQADPHKMVDAVRGVQTEMAPDNALAEATDANGLTAFNTNGFSLGSGVDGYNDDSDNFCAWMWRGGNGTASNGDGSITTTVSANPRAGFSLVSWTTAASVPTSATLGHGLGAIPSLVVVKCRDTGSRNWLVYHGSTTASDPDPEDLYSLWNTDAAPVNSATAWNDTAPTSTVFTVGNLASAATANDKMIAYVWTPIPGFSSMGTYTGNANANGPYINTGFSPAYVVLKNTIDVGSWLVYDNLRNPDNITTSSALEIDTAAVESTTTGLLVDFYATGFKIRSADNAVNKTGDRFIYWAFASAPFQTANAR